MTSGLLHQLYSHAVLLGLDSLTSAFLPPVSDSLIFSWALMVVRVPALPRCRGRVCAGEIGVVQEWTGKRPSISQLPISLHQSVAEVQPLCGFWGHVLVGDVGHEQSWVPRRGPPHCSWGCAPPVLCSDRPTMGTLAWERPRGWSGVPVGAAPSAMLPFPHCGVSPALLWEPLGDAGPAIPGEHSAGRRVRGAAPAGMGLPFPPPSLASQNLGRVSCMWQ